MRAKLTIALLLISGLAFGQTMSINWLRQSTYTASGTNTYTVTATSVTQYVAGLELKILFTNANTGASTLNVNALGARTLQKNGAALASGDIAAGGTYRITFDGTNFQVLGIGGSGGGGGVTAGDKGDITVTLGPENWTIDNNAVTNAKINDVSWSKITGTPTFWNSASGTTLTNNNTIATNGFNVSFTGTGKLLLNGTATNAPIDFLPITADPSPLADGDFWYRDGGGSSRGFRVHMNGATRNIMTGADFGINQIPYLLNTFGNTTSSANLVFDGTTLLVGGGTATANTRLDVRGPGTTASTFGLRIANSANVPRLTLDDEGTLNLNTTVNTHTWSGTTYSGWSSLIGSGGGSNLQAGQVISIAGGTNPFRFDVASVPTGGAAIEIRETTFDTNVGGANSGAFIRTKGGFTRTSGTNTHTHLQLNPTYNTTGTYSGTVIGIDYNPTLTSLTGATHIAWRNTSGSVLIGGTSLTANNIILDVQSTTRAIAGPRMTQTQRDAISSPTAGMLLFNTNSNLYNFHNGTAWQSILGSQTSSSDLGSANFQIQASSVKRRTETFYSANVDGTSWNGSYTQTNVLNTVPNNSVVVIRATFIGLQTSGTPGSSGFHYVIERAFRRNATTTSAIAATTTIVASNDTGDTFTLVPTLTTSGSNINFERTLSTTKTFLVSLKLEVSIIEQ